MKLDGKIAVITGASTGIGRAVAVEFAKEGAFVIINARSVSGLEKTLDLVKSGGGAAKLSHLTLGTLVRYKNSAQK